MLRALLTSLALAGTAATLAALATRAPSIPAEQREALFTPDQATRRFVDDEGCVVTCYPFVEHDSGEACDAVCGGRP